LRISTSVHSPSVEGVEGGGDAAEIERDHIAMFVAHMNEVASALGCYGTQFTRSVAVCCSVLQCVAMCCSVVQCVAVCCSAVQCGVVCCSVLRCVAVCCSVLQCAAGCCSVLQCVAVC